MRPGPKNNPFGAHRPKKNAPSGTLPKPKKLLRPASPNRKIAPSGAPPGRMVSSSGALSDQKKRPRQHTLTQAGLSTGAPSDRMVTPSGTLPGPKNLPGSVRPFLRCSPRGPAAAARYRVVPGSRW